MDKIKNILNYLSEKNHFSFYLSIFRVFLGIHIIKKVYLIWGSQSILLSNGTLFEHRDIITDYLGFSSQTILENSSTFLMLIVLTCILMMFGIGKRITIFVLYFLIKILQDLTYPILNGGDNLMIFVILYLAFANSFEHLTLFKSKEKKSKDFSNFLSNLAVYSICIHLGYVYFISAIHKIHADVWFNGTALYYILNIERFSSPISGLIKSNGFITTVGTYFTLLFELLFIFLVWDKRFTKLFLISGIFLHLGIYFFMMIYDFEIFFISLYGFFLPNSLFEKISEKINTLKHAPIFKKLKLTA
ncbi:hypothetical protein [Tenacibaculum amylolyticum]|uniref:hypothetical protein n=1 Tax=Tenacibaculum amylolyticum TaxID=104269 RepID=UPI003895EB5A